MDLTNWTAAMEWARSAPHVYPDDYAPVDQAWLDGADHYDAIRIFQNVRDYTGDATWDLKLAAAILRNREGFVRPQGGATQGHHAWNWGLARDYERTGSELSRTMAIQVRKCAAFNGDGVDPGFFWNWSSSRETAFALLNHLAAEDMGQPSTARVHQLAGWSATHIDQWIWGAATSTHSGPRPFFLYVRPFMVGLTCDALIRYWDRYRNHPSCPAGIPAAIGSVLDWIWAHCWRESDQTFDYTDIDTVVYDAWTTGTVASASSDTVFSGDAALSAVDNYYVFGLLQFLTGARTGDVRWISGYAGSTRSFTLLGAGSSSPAPGDTFLVSTTGTANPGGSGGPGPTPALSLLTGPAYAWYYLHSGDDTYRVRHDAIFAGSSPGSRGFTTWTFISQKEYNQSYRLSFQGLKWRDQGVSPWPAATALTFTAPDGTTGRANAWSGRLQVALSGTNVSVTGPVTITLSDGGAGGTVRGNPILTTDHPAIVLGYRPPAGSAGTTITLSLTNDGGLTNPAPITYTVSGPAPVATSYALTGPAAGPVGSPSSPFTLALTPTGSVPPADFDVDGGLVIVWLLDSLVGGSALTLEGCTAPNAVLVPLTSAISSLHFTYTAPAPGTTSIRHPLFSDLSVFGPEPAARNYTAPAPVVGGRIRLRTAAGRLRLRI